MSAAPDARALNESDVSVAIQATRNGAPSFATSCFVNASANASNNPVPPAPPVAMWSLMGPPCPYIADGVMSCRGESGSNGIDASLGILYQIGDCTRQAPVMKSFLLAQWASEGFTKDRSNWAHVSQTQMVVLTYRDAWLFHHDCSIGQYWRL